MEHKGEAKPSVKDQASAVQDDAVQQLADRLFAAKQSTETEVKMSLWDALRLYPMASMWSLLISFAVVMEGGLPCYRDGASMLTCFLGYDIILVGSFCR